MSQKRDLQAVIGLYIFYFAAFAVYSVFINAYFREIGLSGTQIGLINGIAPLMTAISSPLWGVLSDRTGRARLMLAIAGLVAIAAVGSMGFSRSIMVLAPLAGLWGIGHNAISPMLDAANLRALAGDNVRFARQRMWGSVSFVVVALSAGWLLERTGLRAIFVLYPGLIILMLILLPLLSVQPRPVTTNLRADLGDLLRQRAWVWFMLSLIPLWMGVNSQYAMLTVYLKDLGASPALFGSISALGAASEVILMRFSNTIIERVGLKRMLVTAYGFYVLRMLAYAFLPGPEWALPLALMHILTFAPFFVAGVVYVSQLVPERMRTTGQALFYTAMSVAVMLGSPLAGSVYDTLGGRWLFLLSAGMCALALGVLVFSFRQAGSARP